MACFTGILPDLGNIFRASAGQGETGIAFKIILRLRIDSIVPV